MGIYIGFQPEPLDNNKRPDIGLKQKIVNSNKKPNNPNATVRTVKPKLSTSRTLNNIYNQHQNTQIVVVD